MASAASGNRPSNSTKGQSVMPSYAQPSISYLNGTSKADSGEHFVLPRRNAKLPSTITAGQPGFRRYRAHPPSLPAAKPAGSLSASSLCHPSCATRSMSCAALTRHRKCSDLSTRGMMGGPTFRPYCGLANNCTVKPEASTSHQDHSTYRSVNRHSDSSSTG